MLAVTELDVVDEEWDDTCHGGTDEEDVVVVLLADEPEKHNTGD